MITIICPVLNEEKNIREIIDFFLKAKPDEKELFLIDGGSTDNTLSIINEAVEKYPNIHLYINKDKYVPFALNIGIKNSNGDPVIRLDGHTSYQIDYFEKILNTFETTGADIVGGPMRVVGKTSFQRSVAYCTSCVFGIGDSKIHNENYFGESDHVYLGAWKRRIFDEVGYFDEQLKRNQDDEFHYRAKSKGKQIFLNPEIKSYYYPRSSLFSLIKQYFQYGFYKPLVLKKVKSEIKLRHLIPSFFVIYLIILSFVSHLLLAIPLIIYLIILIYYSFSGKLSSISVLNSMIVFPAIHISYGLGFILGFSIVHKGQF